MKLTRAQVERALDQFDAQAIPEGHPVMTELTDLFGDHTFFVNSQGLNIVEPASPANGSGATGRVINLANWADSTLTKLAPHEPEMTEIAVDLAA